MGAWGHKTFEDDSSLDLIDEWVNSDDAVSTMEQAIKEALASEYLDYEQGQAISVAAAVLDYKLNPGSTELQENEEMIDGLDVWLQTLDADRLKALAPDVIKGLDMLVGENSELAELWAENEEIYPQWRQVSLDRNINIVVRNSQGS